jgi:colicin import membrane protein
MKPVLILLIASLAATAYAADERARIAQERRQAEALYDARQRACQSEFAVTACVDRAKAERRTTLEQLAQQQAVLDDQQRRLRAAQRMQQIHEKTSQSDAKGQTPHTASPPVQVKAPRVSRAASAAVPRTDSAASGPSIGAEERARNRADFERRQRQAAEHRDELARRAVERASTRDRPVAPLPARPEIPASAASR